MKNCNIISIGEILFDVYTNSKTLGGAPFNLIYHVWKFTGNAKFISRIGNDENGDEILQRLEKISFDTRLIQIDDNRPTGIVNVLLDHDGIPSYDIIENVAYDFIEYNSQIKNELSSNSLVAFGTLAQRNNVGRETIHKIFESDAALFCDLNLRQNYYDRELIETLLKQCHILKINEDELKVIDDLILKTGEENQIDLSIELLKKYDLKLLALTLGREGAVLFDGEKYSKEKSSPVEIVDTVGAGDAFSSIVCIGYSKGWEPEKIITTAVSFAADICKINGAIPNNDEIYNKYTDLINEDK
ncbi:MAG: carbohydrate kinase [Ignavibacteria bacterium]|jgi:fructokinase